MSYSTSTQSRRRRTQGAYEDFTGAPGGLLTSTDLLSGAIMAVGAKVRGNKDSTVFKRGVGQIAISSLGRAITNVLPAGAKRYPASGVAVAAAITNGVLMKKSWISATLESVVADAAATGIFGPEEVALFGSADA